MKVSVLPFSASVTDVTGQVHNILPCQSKPVCLPWTQVDKHGTRQYLLSVTQKIVQHFITRVCSFGKHH